jgi:hypothetical protein
MLLHYFEAGVREHGIKRAVRYDYHATARHNYPEEFP